MKKWRVYLPVAVILAAFVWSAATIAAYRLQARPPGAKVILRIGHWQLEAGVRDAINQMAAEYRQLHPEVHIVQDAIPESTYGQWLTTQLMGGTAPDLIEVGKLPQPILIGYLGRYFVPLTPWVNLPNPHNAGGPFAETPLRQTYKDGMRGGYVEELQEYMSVPLSVFGVRVFYNQTLYQQLTGRTEPPKDYREFIAACQTIARHRNARGEPYVPIVGSRYHFQFWDGGLSDVLTFPALRLVDLNRDGYVGVDEVYVAVQTGRISLQHPAYLAKLNLTRQLAPFFQPGYTGLTRDEGVFLFAQQRAVFITSGTWDAISLAEQARGIFEVGVMDFPLPAKDDPDFGPFIEGPRYENPTGGFNFGITRTCRHPEVALDFLLYMASQRKNEEINRIIGWIPCIRDAATPPMLTAFEPHLEGVLPAFNVNLGGETWIKWLQLYSLFQVQQISQADLLKEFEPFYKTRGQLDYAEWVRNRVRARQKDEQFLAGYRARVLSATNAAEATSLGIKYRNLTFGRAIHPELYLASLARQLEDGPVADPVGPYEYRPEVLERIRQRLR